MRGSDISQPKLFVTNTVSDFVPKDHPLRLMRELIDEALLSLDRLFDDIYADLGKASVAPERLIRASLLQVLYTIRSERQLVEQTHYNMLYRWFVGLEIDDKVWHHSTFSKNRERCSTTRCCRSCSRRCWPLHARSNSCRRIVSASMAR